MKVTDEQQSALDALPKLARRVVLERIADPTLSDVECYRRAGGRAKSDSAASASVSEILKNPKTVIVLDMFKTPATDDAIATREEILRDLTNVSRVSIDDVMSWTTCVGSLLDTETGDESSYPSIITVKNMDEVPKHVLKCIKSVKQNRDGRIELVLEDRMAARKLISDMQGFNAPIKTINAEINAENVSDEDFLNGLDSLGIK